MKCLKEVYDKIKEFEGLSLIPYICAGGKSTIGYGHVMTEDEKLKYKNGITKEMAVAMLKLDIEKAEMLLDNLLAEVGRDCNIYQYSVLVSFTFNCGISNTEKLLDYDGFATRSHDEIARKILKYNKSKGKELAGLTLRRKWESEFYMKNTLEIVEITKIQYMIKPLFPIKETPDNNSKTLMTYDIPVYVNIIDTKIIGDFVSTNRGYVNKSAFYDLFL